MKVSERTLQALVAVICGDRLDGKDASLSPYRTLGAITSFFREFGERDIHPSSGAPSRSFYCKTKLEKFNGTEAMARIVVNAVSFWDDPKINPQDAAALLNKLLRRDGYQLTIEERHLFMQGNEAVTEPYFEVQSLRAVVIDAPSLVGLSEAAITEQVVKARKKVENGDFAGAITNAYTLVESLLKELLTKLNVPFKDEIGDIRKLYAAVEGPLNLHPAGEALESHLKAILQGLKSQVAGLYEVANKGSDRHKRRYSPARHHAKLAVNAAFTLCDFLLDSYEYQESRKAKKAS